MSLRIPITGVTGAFFVFALGFGWFTFRSARKAEESLAILNQNLGRLEANIQQAQKLVDARQQSTAGPQTKLKSVPAVENAAKTVTVNSPLPADGLTTLTRLMDADPKSRAFAMNVARMMVAQEFEPMYRKLGFSPDQIAKFEVLATAHYDDTASVTTSAKAQGLGDPGRAVLQQRVDEDFHARIAKEFGTEVAAAVSLYENESGRLGDITGVVRDSTSLVAPGASPLTHLQAEQLIQLLANSSPSYQRGGRANLNDINWDSAANQAAALLSGSQLQAFKAEAAIQQLSTKVKEFYAKRKTSGL